MVNTFLVEGVQVHYRFMDCHILLVADLQMACSSGGEEHCKTETVHFVFLSSSYGMMEMIE